MIHIDLQFTMIYIYYIYIYYILYIYYIILYYIILYYIIYNILYYIILYIIYYIILLCITLYHIILYHICVHDAYNHSNMYSISTRSWRRLEDKWTLTAKSDKCGCWNIIFPTCNIETIHTYTLHIQYIIIIITSSSSSSSSSIVISISIIIVIITYYYYLLLLYIYNLDIRIGIQDSPGRPGYKVWETTHRCCLLKRQWLALVSQLC